jgi:ATP-dependent Clp protease ATP-binding subunit ClpA
MFERFTDRARRVVVLAQEEARLLNHDYIGTEHILLGLVHEGTGVAARALTALGITEEAVRQRVEEAVGRGKQPAQTGHIPFTPRAKKSLELSLREALQLGHTYIGTEHILLGVIREDESPGAQVLTGLGADLSTVRQKVIELLHGAKDEPRGGRRQPLTQVLGRLDALEARLAALEHRVGTGPDVRDLDEEIAQIRRDKESAIEAQDFETAATLRDRERQLLIDKDTRQAEWTATHRDLPSLNDEVERLRGLLREHGMDPEGGAGAA